MASEGLVRCVFEASIVGSDMEVDQRPYHRNCHCPLHNRTRGCARPSPANAKVSYPVRRAWSENCLVMQAHASTSTSSSPSPSPACYAVGVDKASFHRLQSQGSLQKMVDESSGVSWEF